jgi:hypothetical protein
MSQRGRKKWKGQGGPSYSKLVHAYFQSPQYAKLSPRAVKLLVDLLAQYRGTNNGDLTTAWSVMRERGWRSKHLLYMAIEELDERGWILKTRQGQRAKGIHSATLWAVTFEGINDCRDSQGQRKLDPGIQPDTRPLHLWKTPSCDKPAPEAKRAFRKQSNGPTTGKAFPDYRANVSDISAHLSRLSDTFI